LILHVEFKEGNWYLCVPMFLNFLTGTEGADILNFFAGGIGDILDHVEGIFMQ